jgi:hypothetical protein
VLRPRVFLFAFVFLLCGLAWPAAKARILRMEFLRTEPAFAGQQRGNTGAYQHLQAAGKMLSCPPGVPADGTRPVPAPLAHAVIAAFGVRMTQAEVIWTGVVRCAKGVVVACLTWRQPQLRQGRYQKKLHRRNRVVQGPRRCRLHSASCYGECHGLQLALRRKSRRAGTAGPDGRCVGLRCRELARPQAVIRSPRGTGSNPGSAESRKRELARSNRILPAHHAGMTRYPLP